MYRFIKPHHPKTEKYKPKKPSEIEERYKCCLGMVTLSREGSAVFNQGASDNAKKILQGYMLWDKQLRDDAPAIHFDFSGVKAVEYKRDK